MRAVKSELLRCRDVDKATAAEILAGLVEQVSKEGEIRGSSASFYACFSNGFSFVL